MISILLCIVVQSTAVIKALVPTFGMVVPKECQVSPAFGGCPPFPPSHACVDFTDQVITRPHC